MELVEEVSFISFLNGFLEDGNLVHYPDFVMNNVSYMAAEVLSSCDDCISLEELAFFIIRSPLHYWMVSKGHRVDVTFQIYRKWVQQKRLLHLLDRVQCKLYFYSVGADFPKKMFVSLLILIF